LNPDIISATQSPLLCGSARYEHEGGLLLWEKRQSLAVQPRKLHHHVETFSGRKIEGKNFILSDAIEIAIGTEANSAWTAKFGQAFGTKDAHKMPIRGVVFTYRRHGVGCSKWILAGHDDVAIRPDRQVKGTEFWVTHKPRSLHVVVWGECDNVVIPLTHRTNPRT
jgi:hypothetical protein